MKHLQSLGWAAVAGLACACGTSGGADRPANTGGAAGTAGAAGADASASGGAGGGGTTDSGPPLGDLVGPEPGLKLALFGDQGNNANSRALLKLIVDQGADAVVHLGDFDYADDPVAWGALMAELGDIPWLAVVGNHDTDAWTGYREVIDQQLAKFTAATCTGEPGVQHACTFRGVHVMLSGIGLMGTGHEAFLEGQLASSKHVWRLCGWHLNQRDMQLGDKGDETGWDVHEVCQARGGIIVNGHEHSYGRTLTLTDVGNSASGHGATGPWDELRVALGSTYLIVSGAGGQSLRMYDAAEHDDDTWWAGGYARNVRIDDGVRTDGLNLPAAGVVFLELGVDGNPRKARGKYQLVDGSVVDEWTTYVDTTGFSGG